MITCSVLSKKRTVSYTNLFITKPKFKNYGNEAATTNQRNYSMLRTMLRMMSRAVSEPVTHSSALTLGRREAERTYSSHKRRKPLPSALKPASSHPVPHRKRYALTCPPPQAVPPTRSRCCCPLLPAPPRTREGREGRPVDRKGLNLRGTKVKGSAMLCRQCLTLGYSLRRRDERVWARRRHLQAHNG